MNMCRHKITQQIQEYRTPLYTQSFLMLLLQVN